MWVKYVGDDVIIINWLIYLMTFFREKLTSMGPSERIETKAKTLKRLTFDKDAFELALTKPCLRFSKAIDTLLR